MRWIGRGCSVARVGGRHKNHQRLAGYSFLLRGEFSAAFGWPMARSYVVITCFFHQTSFFVLLVTPPGRGPKYGRSAAREWDCAASATENSRRRRRGLTSSRAQMCVCFLALSSFQHCARIYFMNKHARGRELLTVLQLYVRTYVYVLEYVPFYILRMWVYFRTIRHPAHSLPACLPAFLPSCQPRINDRHPFFGAIRAACVDRRRLRTVGSDHPHGECRSGCQKFAHSTPTSNQVHVHVHVVRTHADCGYGKEAT